MIPTSSMRRDYSDEYYEPKRKSYPRCADGFCGATDCPRCSPERFRGGVHEDDSLDNCPTAEDLEWSDPDAANRESE